VRSRTITLGTGAWSPLLVNQLNGVGMPGRSWEGEAVIISTVGGEHSNHFAVVYTCLISSA
jgi:hypothetical protein